MLMFCFLAISLVAEYHPPFFFFFFCYLSLWEPLFSEYVGKKKDGDYGKGQFLFWAAWREGDTREFFKNTNSLTPF